jgi:hypothetical protein
VTAALWAELLEKLVPVLSGISIAIIAWLNGKKSAKLENRAEAAEAELETRRRIDEAENKRTAELNGLSADGLRQYGTDHAASGGPVRRD